MIIGISTKFSGIVIFVSYCLALPNSCDEKALMILDRYSLIGHSSL